ncbi:MAG: flagellar assembly protein FliW [Lachnospiraceae bacterium]|nr:flagellar assembly protein FliW [Lachnospiraceae bacterium]
MKINTKNFGEIEIDDNKVIEFPNGIIGFDDLKKFTIIYDSEKEDTQGIMWLQSLDEEGFAMPVVNPLFVTDNYDPKVEEDLIKGIGDFSDEDLIVFCTVSVPIDIKNLSVNLKAPILINTATKKGIQVIVENEEYEVKHGIYDYLQSKKGK